MSEDEKQLREDLRELKRKVRVAPEPWEQSADPWRARPMLGFDTETTGVDPESARIVTACVGIGSGDGWHARNWLLRQSSPIPAEATEIHGISTEHANDLGMDASTALGQIRDDLYKAWEMGMPVCGFNIVYDLTVLDRECRRHNLGSLDVRGPVLDPLVMDKAVDRYRKGSRKLIAVAGHYGIHLSEDDAHGAEPDALAATRLAWKIGGHPDLRDLDLDALTEWQTHQYATQRRSFADYMARKGEPLTDPSTDWPLRPYRQEIAA